MINAHHNPYSEYCRCPQGAVPAGSGVSLRLTCDTNVKKAVLRLWLGKKEELIPMHSTTAGSFEAQIMAAKVGVIYYYFILETESGVKNYLGKPIGGISRVFEQEPTSYQITVYDPAFVTPEWMRNSVMMQIMVDRFAIGGQKIPPHAQDAFMHGDWYEPPVLCKKESLDFFGGNLDGIREKLPFIKDMGIGALYLNPIFRARSNHKYDTGDYMEVDPSFGGNAALDRLLSDCEKENIHVVLDGVFSHTGVDSRYFNRFGTYDSKGAYSNYGDSPYSPWYTFKKNKDDYECWWGINTLPNVNELEPSYLKYIIEGDDSVVGHYIGKGTSGWRLDVADELPMEFIRKLRARAKKENADACVIGEVWEDVTNKVCYGETRCYASGDTLDSAMNYPMRDNVIAYILGKINAETFAEFLNYQISSLPPQMLMSMMNMLGSHDKPRIINVLAQDEPLEPEHDKRMFKPLSKEKYELGKARFIKAFELICALPGMPCLYYGDDAGLTGMGDPFCRRTYPWGREDTELQSEIKRIIARRNAVPALRTGSAEVTAKNGAVEIVRKLDGHEERLTVKQ